MLLLVMTKRLTLTEIEEVFSLLSAENPEPKGELYAVNTYTFLVAVALSAQSTDKGVNKATSALFEKVTTPLDMVALGEEGLIDYIKTIGLYRSKARNVIKMAHQLIDRHNGCVPESSEALEALAGVGRKTANVVRNICFGVPTLAVDTHIFRVSQRLGLSFAKTPDKMMDDLPKRIPENYKLHAHHWLILHGRYVCKARTPQCGSCLLAHLCPSKNVSIG